MADDPRLLTADLSALVAASGFALSSSGGVLGGAHSLTLHNGPTIPAASWRDLPSAFLRWLDEQGRPHHTGAHA